jgi:hypothetical protein
MGRGPAPLRRIPPSKSPGPAPTATPQPRAGTAALWWPRSPSSTLGESLDLGSVNEDDLYEAMDWLVARQPAVEAARYPRAGTAVLYDLTSTYFEGHHCPLARYGYSRDERRANPQIVFGWLSDTKGCPVAVDVFEGNTGDPKTVAAQVAKVRERFHLERTEQDLAELTPLDYRGERLIVCRNPLLTAERVRKCKEVIEAATQRSRPPLRGVEKISYRVGQALASSKVEKYSHWTAGAAALQWERAFRPVKSVDLNVRTICHRVRAHFFIAILAHYVEWHMRTALAPVLFDDEQHGGRLVVSGGASHPR